ncbi:hypothetical protein [uncultured Mesotoga sp.]|uniref:hypothetical protein n=1 Tax=uncultured Mesotoga sp. TaxID=1184400 RepID=UPI0025990E9E|nr:hypothetical protein [uncultured Mesotoga sp.]
MERSNSLLYACKYRGNRIAFEKAVLRFGLRIVYASSVEDLREAMRNEEFCLTIADISGFEREILDELKEYENSRKGGLLIVLPESYTKQEIGDSFSHVMTKPLKVPEVLRLIRYYSERNTRDGENFSMDDKS